MLVRLYTFSTSRY